MSDLRRRMSMVGAAVSVLALAFVVSVAAFVRTDDADEPLLDLDIRADLDLTAVTGWLVLGAAVAGAVLIALGLGRRTAVEEGRRRNLLGTVIGLILFVVLLRWLRPAAESLLGGDTEVASRAADPLIDQSEGASGAWLFAVLLAAVFAAALTRIGMSVREVTFRPGAEAMGLTDLQLPVVAGDPTDVPLGDDPRSRILTTYARFEEAVSSAGSPRLWSETTARHADRARLELSLDSGAVATLVATHAQARYGSVMPTEAEARAADASWEEIEGELGR